MHLMYRPVKLNAIIKVKRLNVQMLPAMDQQPLAEQKARIRGGYLSCLLKEWM